MVEQGTDMHGGLRKLQDRWYPIVYRSKQSSRPLVPRERFTVAHELAHAIVDDQLRLRPLRRSQYWALEGVCDDFAGRLLIPEKQFLAARAAMSGASSALSGIEALARTTNTSLIVAARRVLEGCPQASAWGVLQEKRRIGTAYRVTWTAGARRYGLTLQSDIKELNPVFDVVAKLDNRVGIRGEVTVAGGMAAYMRPSPRSWVIAWWQTDQSEGQTLFVN